MSNSLPRLVVYSADMQRITGKSLRSCQRVLNRIRDMFGLKRENEVTVYQASEYLGIPVPVVSRFLDKK